jgi:hypothetical protein
MRSEEKTLNERQAEFTSKLAELIVRANLEGIKVSLRDVRRTPEEQHRRVQEGTSMTMGSKHLLSLAADLVVVKDRMAVLKDCEEYHRLGEIWEMLGGIWGGSWSQFKDIFHFEWK